MDSPLMYSVSLLDEAGPRLLVFRLERHEALPVVAALNNWTLPPAGQSANLPGRRQRETQAGLPGLCAGEGRLALLGHLSPPLLARDHIHASQDQRPADQRRWQKLFAQQQNRQERAQQRLNKEGSRGG